MEHSSLFVCVCVCVCRGEQPNANLENTHTHTHAHTQGKENLSTPHVKQRKASFCGRWSSSQAPISFRHTYFVSVSFFHASQGENSHQRTRTKRLYSDSPKSVT